MERAMPEARYQLDAARRCRRADGLNSEYKLVGIRIARALWQRQSKDTSYRMVAPATYLIVTQGKEAQLAANPL